MEHLIIEWITQYGDAALFGLLVLGIVGLPVPDETLLTFAGALVRRGHLALVPTLGAAWLGGVIGITVSYALGRSVGAALLVRYGRFVRLDSGAIDRVTRWFDRSGKWTLTFGYFVPGVRHVSALVAGSSSVAFPVFAAFSYAGALIWVLSLLSLGYYVGENWRAAVRDVHHHLGLVAIGLLVALGAHYLARHLRPSGNGPGRR
jgi:membrane protein DedA with SNARE-associated domain